MTQQWVTFIENFDLDLDLDLDLDVDSREHAARSQTEYVRLRAIKRMVYVQV